MRIDERILKAPELGDDERVMLAELMQILHSHADKNEQKRRYYEGHITLGEVNLGLALPSGMRSNGPETRSPGSNSKRQMNAEKEPALGRLRV